MKSFIVFAVIIGAALAAPLESESEAVSVAPLVALKAAGKVAKAVVLEPVVAAETASEVAKEVVVVSEAPLTRAGYAPRPLTLTLTPDGEAVILRYESDNIGIGGYSWGYDTSNGISHAEEATLEDNGIENPPSLAVIGQYSYTGPDGRQYTVFYRSDKNGFQPQGDHLPVA